MPLFLCCLLVFAYGYAAASPAQQLPQQSLNVYMSFLNQSVDVVTNHVQLIQTYYVDASYYRQHPDVRLKLPSSGPLEEYYYRQALAADGLTPAETQRLEASAKGLWALLTRLDQTTKTLETYVRLRDYERDGLKKSDALLNDVQQLVGQFR